MNAEERDMFDKVFDEIRRLRQRMTRNEIIMAVIGTMILGGSKLLQLLGG